MAKIEVGTPVRVGRADGERELSVKTVSAGPLVGQVREYNRALVLGPGRFLFGTVGGVYETLPELRDEEGNLLRPAKYSALVHWAGKRCRTSVLPVMLLTPRGGVRSITRRRSGKRR